VFRSDSSLHCSSSTLIESLLDAMKWKRRFCNRSENRIRGKTVRHRGEMQ
jgi:hypothetical protein